MNTYKITFTRENGTVGSDNFTAPSEAQARRDFKEVYRHGNGTIEELRDKLAESEKDYEAAHATAHQIAEEKDAEIASLKSRLLADDDLADISRLLSKTVADLGKEVSDAAARIVEVADQPESAAFRNAVKDHRAAKADLSHWTELLTRVNNTKNRA